VLDESCHNHNDNRQKDSDNHGASDTLMYHKQTPVVHQHLDSIKVLKYLNTK
jgi:hypothetical protein